MRAFLFVRNLTTNQPLEDYDYYFYSEELTYDIYDDVPFKLQVVESPRITLVKEVLAELSSYLKKPIYPVNKNTLKDLCNTLKVHQVCLRLPEGESSYFESHELIKVIPSKTSKTYVLGTFTKFHKNLNPEKEFFNPNTYHEKLVVERLDSYKSKVKEYQNLRSKIKISTSLIAPLVALGVMGFNQLYTWVKDSYEDSLGKEEYLRQISWILYCKLKKIPPLQVKTFCEEPSYKNWMNGVLPSSEVTDILNEQITLMNSGALISNRSRLMLAYYLIKPLSIWWQYGELYFRKSLIDYHPKVNRYNWYAQSKNRFLSKYNLKRQINLYA